jgi:hypothetical protein
MSTRAQKCVADAVAQGRVSEAMAARVIRRVDELLGKGLDEAQAMRQAAHDVLLAAAEKKRQASKRIVLAARNEALAESHPNGFGAGVRALLARDLHQAASYSNVEGRQRAIRGMAHARLAEFLDRYRGKVLGLMRDQEGLERWVRAVYGEGGDAETTALARAWDDTVEMLRRRFIAAGGSKLTRREEWRMPQVWDSGKLRAAGRDAYLDWMHQQLAAGRLRIRDYDTGLEADPLRQAEILSRAYDRITTEGLVDLVPGRIQGRGVLADAHARTRAFEWTSAEGYLDFLDRFGPGKRGLYDLLNGHVDAMARDVAMLEVLGPNPDWMVRYLRDTAMKRAADPGAAKRQAWLIDSTWHWVSGAGSEPVNELAATVMRELRGVLTAAQLGSAFISSMSDFATMRQVAAWNGAGFTRVLGRYLRLMNPADPADRQLAVRTGLIAETWAQRAVGAMRHQADIVGQGIGGRVADLVLRASLLSPHTESGRWAIGLELLATAGEQAGRRFEDLSPALRRGLSGYGIGAAEWDLARAAGVIQEGGLTLLSPAALARAADPATAEGRARLGAATRLLEWAQTEGRMALPEVGATERALTLGQTRPGTLSGELLRGAMQFKSFPVAVMLMHLGRGLNAARQGDYGRYLASFTIGVTAMGALTLQMRQISQGRDPRDMTDWRFWAAAYAQGGGAGILGDFLYSAVTRTDQDFYAMMFGGPTGGLVSDVAKVAGLNLSALDDERRERAIGADLARLARRYTPGTSLWYSRLAMDRLLWDELQRAVDDQAPRRWRQIERRWLREFDQEFWWRPGERAPQRAPLPGRAVGGD